MSMPLSVDNYTRLTLANTKKPRKTDSAWARCRRGRCDTAEAEQHALWRVVERRLWRGGMEIAH